MSLIIGLFLFAGETDAIRAGEYDRQRRNIAWYPQPEWRGSGADRPSPRARLASLAACNGKLYATSGGAIYERVDGASATWKKIFETTLRAPSNRVTGLRGLACLHASLRSADVLLVSVGRQSIAHTARLVRAQHGA